MRSYLLAIDEVKQGIELDVYKEKMLCEAVPGIYKSNFCRGLSKRRNPVENRKSTIR